MRKFLPTILILAGMCLSNSAGVSVAAVKPAVPNQAVIESVRDIPVAYDVDVVVVGGSSAGVGAAVAAAEEGATVFLAAQRPYLGEDICGTYRLWLDADAEPKSELAKKIFAEPDTERWPQGLPLLYEASRQSAAMHKDNGTKLTDGKFADAASQSVQYDGSVEIIADLGKNIDVSRVTLMTYQRMNEGADDNFEVKKVTISVSNDKQKWEEVVTVSNPQAGESVPEPWGPVPISAKIDTNARYLNLQVDKADDVERILLGEIIVESSDSKIEPRKRPKTPPTPMQVKRVLDQALLDAGVDFLYGCYATDMLVDSETRPAGIIMANRSGRQAVKAKVIIDATQRASMARIAGVRFSKYPAGKQTFKRIIAGGEPVEGIRSRPMPAPLPTPRPNMQNAFEYTLEIEMPNGSFASFARAEQIARDRTWRRDQGRGAEILFQIPPDAMTGRDSIDGKWPGAEDADIDAFRPEGLPGFYVLGACAAVSRQAAADLAQTLELLRMGERIGRAAAGEAQNTRQSGKIRVQAVSARPVAEGDTREKLAPIRTTAGDLGRVHAEKRAIPVLGRYDVVVIGGGTGGAPAGISAARQGSKTLVVEYLNDLGGVGTAGLISSYYFGYREGFTAEVDQGVADIAGGTPSAGWNPEWKSEWYRKELRKAGADIWYRTLGCGAFVEDGKVRGAVVATPHGRGVVLAKVVIDSTGSSDIAQVAGAETVYTDQRSVAVQGTGLPPWKLGTGYTNTDWTFVDDTDVVDAWRSYITAKSKYKGAFDLGQLIDTRERRRIVGEFIMSPMDIMLGRTYPDTIVISRSNFDSHGYTVHPLFLIRPPDKKVMLVNVPYRCLLPQGLEGILVTGLGVSAHRDAMPVIRMQADIQNQGYAAGVAASMAARNNKPLRQIDIKSLQEHLVNKGNIPEAALTAEDSMPMSKDRIARAVRNVAKNYNDLKTVLAQTDDSIPMLKEAYAEAETKEARLIYAHILGMLGENDGSDELLEAVRATEWDKGWNYKGMGQFGASISALDSLIIALGRTKDPRALNAITNRVAELDSDSAFSHCRAVAMAVETLDDPRAAESLAQLLRKPGMMGHAFTDIEEAVDSTPGSGTDNSTRNNSLKELILARALYRCGDHEGLGRKILEEYSRDLRGHYARHAAGILQEK